MNVRPFKVGLQTEQEVDIVAASLLFLTHIESSSRNVYFLFTNYIAAFLVNVILQRVNNAKL